MQSEKKALTENEFCVVGHPVLFFFSWGGSGKDDIPLGISKRTDGASKVMTLVQSTLEICSRTSYTPSRLETQ